MLHIALCDDDSVLLDFLDGTVSKCLRTRGIAATITRYERAADFSESLTRTSPDLVFMDLVLDDMSGYALASALRERSLDIEIIFVTNYPERMQDAFAHRAIGFLTKPVTDEQIDRAIERFLAYHWHGEHCYELVTKESIQRIPHREILYFESDARHVGIHLKGNQPVIWFYGRLDKVEAEVAGFPYLRCHKSILVQVNAIRTLDRNGRQFGLTDGTAIPISQAAYAHSVSRFLDFLARKG